MLPRATWMAPGACPDFHSLLSLTSSRVAPSRTRSRACSALTFEPRRPSAGCPPKSRRSRSKTEGVGLGVDEVVKVGSIRHAQHTPWGIRLDTTCPGPDGRGAHGYWHHDPHAQTSMGRTCGSHQTA